MGKMLLPLVFLALIPVSVLAAWICMGVWVYRDAKNRGLEAGLWTIVVMVAPNLIGLLLYFILGRGKAQVLCRSCGSKVPSAAQYCPNCGQQMNADNIEQSSPRRNTRRPLVGIAVCFAVFIASLLAMGIFAFVGIQTGSSSVGAQSSTVAEASCQSSISEEMLDMGWGDTQCLSCMCSGIPLAAGGEL